MEFVDQMWQLFTVQYPVAGMSLAAAAIFLVLVWGVRLSAH